MSDFNLTTAAVAVTNHGRAGARLESTYDGLVSFYMLTPDTTSADVTAYARAIVLVGAANDGTATGAALTIDDLTGRDPGADAGNVRQYWKAARAVRIGLVSAIKRAAGDSDDTDDTDEKPVNLLTRAGLKASLEDVVAAWEAANAANNG